MADSREIFICYLCRRKFDGFDHLMRHESSSQLHSTNLKNLQDTVNSRRNELRDVLITTREECWSLIQIQQTPDENPQYDNLHQEPSSASIESSYSGMMVNSEGKSLDIGNNDNCKIQIKDKDTNHISSDSRECTIMNRHKLLRHQIREFEKELGWLQYNTEQRILNPQLSTLFDSKGVIRYFKRFPKKLKGKEKEKDVRIPTKVSNLIADNLSMHTRNNYTEKDISSNFRISFGATTWRGNKATNEDRFILDLRLAVPQGDPQLTGFAVFDGHSGEACVDYIVEHLSRNISRVLETKNYSDRFEDRLTDSVYEAFILTDDDWLLMAQTNNSPDGSTASVIILWEDEYKNNNSNEIISSESRRDECKNRRGFLKLLSAHVGDSRSIMCRGDTVTRLSEDHKPDVPEERSRIESVGGIVAEMSNVWRVFTPEPVAFGDKIMQCGLAVSRAFGDYPLKKPSALVSSEPTISVREISFDSLKDEGNKKNIEVEIVVACDGIFDVMTDTEVCDVLRYSSIYEQNVIHETSNCIVKRAYELLSDDNLTVIVARVSLKVNEQETKKRRLLPQEEV